MIIHKGSVGDGSQVISWEASVPSPLAYYWLLEATQAFAEDLALPEQHAVVRSQQQPALARTKKASIERLHLKFEGLPNGCCTPSMQTGAPAAVVASR